MGCSNSSLLWLISHSLSGNCSRFLASVFFSLLSAMDSGQLSACVACDGTNGGTTTCVGEVVLNLLPSVTRSSRVSSIGTPRASPITSPKVLSKDSNMVLPASGPRVPSVANPRASGLVASGSPLRCID